MATVQSQYGDGAAPDSLRASPSRGLPAKEPYYSNRDIAILHSVITAAQEQLDQATGPKPLPAAALFKAYDEVLPEHGVDPDTDQHLSALVFRVGGEQGGGSLLEKFQSILGHIGIVLEFSDDSITTSQDYHQHPLSPEPIDTGHWDPDDLPIKEEDAPVRTRRRTYSAGSLDYDPVFQKIRAEAPSYKKISQTKDDLALMDADAYPSVPISTTATRHLDQYHQHPSPIFDHLPVDFRAVDDGIPYDDVKAHVVPLRTDISHSSSKHKSERTTPPPLRAESPRPTNGRDQKQASHTRVNGKINQMPGLQDKHNSPIGANRDASKTDAVDVLASHSTQDELPLPFRFQGENTLSKQQQAQLLTRATRAREIYLASKVFNHWADRTAARLEREGVARRHMIRFRCFQGWSRAPSLQLPIIDHLKALTAVQKLQRAVSFQEEQLRVAATAISQRYRARTASRVYDQWCSHLVSLVYRQKINRKLKQGALVAWISNTSSNTIKSQAIRKFNRHEGVATTLSKLQDQALLHSHQSQAARQIGSLRLLFRSLDKCEHQIQVKARSSAYKAKLSTAAVIHTFHNWNLSVRVQAFRWRADYISVTRALDSWRRHYVQDEWKRNVCADRSKSYRASHLLYTLQRSSDADAQLSVMSNRARLFIVTTRTLPIMDAAVEAQRLQMKDLVRQYLMMRYTEVSSARKKRKFYEAFDHWRVVATEAASESEFAALYNTKYYYGQLDVALEKWKKQAEEDVQLQLATYQHYTQAVLAAWGDIAKEHNQADMQSLELWASRRQRQYLKAWSISSLQRSGQAHTATKVERKNCSEKRNRTFQYWKQACLGPDFDRVEQDLRFTPNRDHPSGRRSAWRALSVRRHLLVERHNKQDSAARPMETPTRSTGVPLNMSFPLSAKPIVAWRGTDGESTASSDTEDMGGMLKSPSKTPATARRGILTSTTPRGPVPMHLNVKAARPEVFTSPHRWSTGDAVSKSKPGLSRDVSNGPQPNPRPNLSRSVASFGRSVHTPAKSPARLVVSAKPSKKAASLLPAEVG
ncbi:Sfi1 spindle body domain-containing protein [Trichoderma austrokoningii]